MSDKPLTEQEWVYQYVKKRESPLPVVLGTRGTWTVQGQPVIILVAFTMVDIMAFRDMHGVPKHPIRTIKYKDMIYYAVNIIGTKSVESIMKFWEEKN